MGDWEADLENREREAVGDPLTPGDRIVANTYRMLDEFADFYASRPELEPVTRIALALASIRIALTSLDSDDPITARLYLPDAITHLERAVVRLSQRGA